MRKLIIFFLISILPVSLFAETKTAGIELQGAYGVALNMNINAIAAQTESFLSGMPFNIEEQFVQYQPNSDGRAIATWNVLSNSKFNIYIKADNMVNPTAEVYNPKTALSYILTFSYNLSYPGSSSESSSGSFWLTSGSTMAYGATNSTTQISTEEYGIEGASIPSDVVFYKINLFSSESDFPDFNTGFTGSVDGRIFFKFTEPASNALTSSPGDYPVGNYTASVTFFVEVQ